MAARAAGTALAKASLAEAARAARPDEARAPTPETTMPAAVTPKQLATELAGAGRGGAAGDAARGIVAGPPAGRLETSGQVRLGGSGVIEGQDRPARSVRDLSTGNAMQGAAGSKAAPCMANGRGDAP